MLDALRHNTPLNVHWDLTWRCDHSCVHCYLTERRQDELTLAEAEGILDQLADAGTFSILFSGGDPFLRPDAVDIMRAARDRSFDIRINTHANAIDAAMADRLTAEVMPARVGISVYSVFPEEHDAVTLVPGSHAKTLAGARNLLARGINVVLKTPLMVHNRRGYYRVRELAEALGAAWELDAGITPDDESDFGLCGIAAHPTERVVAMLQEYRGREAPDLRELGGEPPGSATCGAGRTSCHITPDGRLLPCFTWREPLGSLREASFAELWWGNPEADRLRRITRDSYLGDCDGCGFHGSCNYCPGISHAETGDAGRRSAYVCERTHMTIAATEYAGRLQAEGRPIPEPGTPEADALFDGTPSFAERQWAARQAGMSRQADRLPVGLVQIGEPRSDAAGG